MHDIAGLEFPAQIACRRVQRVKISVAASEIHSAICHHRAREKHIKRIGDGLVLRLPSVQTLCFEPALALGCKLPSWRASLRIERVKLSVVTPNVNRAVRNRWCSWNRPIRRSLPNLAAGRSINRVHISVVSAEVNHVIFEDRRRNHAIASWKFPFHAMELSRCRSRIRTGVHVIAAKHRLGINRRRCAKRGERNHNR